MPSVSYLERNSIYVMSSQSRPNHDTLPPFESKSQMSDFRLSSAVFTLVNTVIFFRASSAALLADLLGTNSSAAVFRLVP